MNLLQIHEPGQTPLPHEEVAAVGIDLGTTYSVVAVAEGERVEVIQNIHGHALVPSVVYYGEAGKVEVGYPARLRHDRGETGAVASIKRRMHDAGARLTVAGRTVTPVEVSAEILKALKHNAEQALGGPVAQAVITVPAYFDEAARLATKDAARLAGLEVLRLINEPTAAALAYGLDKGARGIYAVYDLGGGTFDISLLKLEDGVFQVLSTAGDTQLGGDDVDAALVGLFRHPGASRDPSLSAREMKEKLSVCEEIKLDPGLRRDDKTTITRAELERLATPLIERTLTICERAFIDAKCDRRDVQGVVLVGGSTRMPLVRRMVETWFGRPPLVDIDPDEVVACGAAIQAHSLTRGGDHLLLDVIPLSLGLETMGGLTEKLIERNTPIPTSVSQEFTTWQDGQTGMDVHVVQGEREMAAHNRSLAKFNLTGIPPLPAGIARVRVTFAVDADGLLTVSAQEARTGVTQSVHVRPSYGLSPEQMEQMLRDSMARGREDIVERLLAEARMEAERTIIELQSAMKQDDALISGAEKKALERQIQAIRGACAGADRDYIDAEVQQLARLAGPFAQRRMDKAIAGALKGVNINAVGS